MSLWQLMRARAGTTVRDSTDADWVKGPDGRWVDVGLAWWSSAHRQTSWDLWFRFRPLRRMS